MPGNPRQNLPGCLSILLLAPALWACSPVSSGPRTAWDPGRRSYLQGDYQAAIEAFHRRLERQGDDYRIRRYLARSLLLARRGTLEEAARWFRRAIVLDPQDPAGYARLGLVYRRQGEDTIARQLMEKVAQLDPLMRKAARSLEPHGFPTEKGQPHR